MNLSHKQLVAKLRYQLLSHITKAIERNAITVDLIPYCLLETYMQYINSYFEAVNETVTDYSAMVRDDFPIKSDPTLVILSIPNANMGD